MPRNNFREPQNTTSPVANLPVCPLPTAGCTAVLNWLDRLAWLWLLPLAGWMAMAPLTPEPHLVEKLRLLLQGALGRPVDIFDLAMHAAPLVLVALKLGRQWRAARAARAART